MLALDGVELTALQQWLQGNSSNILAGIVSSLIVLGLQTFSRVVSLVIAAFLVFKWRLRTIWRFRDPKRIYVVSGAVTGVSEHVKSVVLAGPDAEAVSALIATAGLLYPGADIRHVYSSTFSRDLWKEHLIVVGGPVNNACAAAILEQVKSDISFKDFDLLCGDSVWSTENSEAETVIKDAGAVSSGSRPLRFDERVMLTMGCETFEVSAAAALISLKGRMPSVA